MKKWKCIGFPDCYMEEKCVIEMDDELEPVACPLSGGAEWEEVVAPANTVQQTKCAKHKWKHLVCAAGMNTYRCEVCGAETDDWMNWGDL